MNIILMELFFPCSFRGSAEASLLAWHEPWTVQVAPTLLCVCVGQPCTPPSTPSSATYEPGHLRDLALTWAREDFAPGNTLHSLHFFIIFNLLSIPRSNSATVSQCHSSGCLPQYVGQIHFYVTDDGGLPCRRRRRRKGASHRRGVFSASPECRTLSGKIRLSPSTFL